MSNGLKLGAQTVLLPASAEPVDVFVGNVQSRGIRLSVAGDRLRCTGSATLLDGGLGDEIRARRQEIIAFLSNQQTIPPRRDRDAPLTAAQMRLWITERIQPETRHHIPFVLEAEGRLDLPALKAAIGRIMGRHEVPRMRIIEKAGQPRQILSDDDPLPFRHSQCPDPALAQALIADEITRPFDLTSAPPLRVCLIDCGADRQILVLTLHHIAADGSSVEMLMTEFAAFYAEGVVGLPARVATLPVQYGDFAEWVAAQPVDDSYWRSQLSTDLPVTRLPEDLPRPLLQGHGAGVVPVAIPQPLASRLRQIGAARGASMLAVLLAAFKVLVARQSGQWDLLIGIPAANRGRAELEPLVGLFVNPLPVISHLDPARGFDAALETVRSSVLDALDHQHVPFERLVEAFQPRRDPGASPLFQIKFQLDRAPRAEFALPVVTLRRLTPPVPPARHDLSLDLTEGADGIHGQFIYRTDLFHPDRITALRGHYLTLLQSIADDITMPLAVLPMLGAAERHDLLTTWNDTRVEIDADARFPALFEAQAAARPDAVAVEHVADGGVTVLTYGALNARANRLAHALRARGAGPDVVIAIAMDRGPDMVAAWLGVMKSGAAWLPLDMAYPPERIAAMLGDSGAALVLTKSGFDLPAGTPRWDLDHDWPDGPEENPAPGTDPQDLAYLIYTSGSTGRPKGVEVPHEGLFNLAREKIATCGPGPGDAVMGFFSFSFDASIPDLVMSLGSGARLVTAPAADVLPGPGFARLMQARRVTHLTITPSALACLSPEALPDLRMVLVGGEAPSPELIAKWAPGRLFINAYGPTECTVNASMVACGNGEAPGATLRAPANKVLHVLDQNLELLPVGCPGELFIGGLGLARGYRGRAGATAAAFVPDPFCPGGGRLYRTGDRALRLPDGRIRLLGRIDDQVKIRGFRIEPGEIAAACRRHPGVEEAVAAARDVPGLGTRLVVWLSGPGQDVEGLRRHLAARLPRHMLPDDLIWLDRLPMTVNGKLDMADLPLPDPQRRRGRAPETPTEIAMAAIYADLLGVDDPGAEDDFFDLGGNSLMATRLAAAIETRFGLELRVLTLFDASTIATLAAVIDGGAGIAPPQTEEWSADIALSPDIRPLPPGGRRLSQSVLLTGATGFVGAHLLAELLRDPAQRVMCLLRGGEDALTQAIAQFGLPDVDLTRVTVLRGDLSLPDLGLSPQDRAQAATTHSIYHAGARVHHLSPYRQNRAANVTGTAEILRLAAESGAAVHYLSTLSALVPAGVVAELDAAAELPPPTGGYNLSKWVAEQLVAEAGKRGIPVTIYRLGSAGAHGQTGAFNPADILTRQVLGYLASGTAPEGEAMVNFLPVDHVARAICGLAADPANAGRVFHLTHSTPIPARAIFDACAAEGHPLRRLPPAEWQAHLRVIAQGDPNHPAYALATLGPAQGFTGPHWPYDAAATRAALAALPDPIIEPPLTGALLRRAVRAMLLSLPRQEEAPA